MLEIVAVVLVVEVMVVLEDSEPARQLEFRGLPAFTTRLVVSELRSEILHHPHGVPAQTLKDTKFTEIYVESVS